MKLADWNLATFTSREAQARDDYINSSLQSSSLLSARLASSPSPDDPRGRLYAMKFHKKWRHSSCAVMGWYELQACRQFSSIQHWRNVDTQFYHEFLIIQLTDGSAYRVERMGEGSRADAIRLTGCAAYDLIQWFSPEDHAAKRWSRGSQEIIIQVDFPRTFDLLDVLAVCYTIQHRSPRASVYTLQRYNCYFLCNTILAVLTRRLAEWENLITEADWPTLVDNMIDELQRKSLLPVKQQQATEFLVLGICSLLNPKNPNPAEFILEPFRLELENRGRNSVNKELANMLWYKYIDSAVDCGLSQCYDRVSDTVLENPDPNSTARKLYTLLEAVNEDHFPPTELNQPSIQGTMSKKLLALISTIAKEVVTMVKWRLQMRELENKPPLSRQLIGSMFGFLAFTLPTPLLAHIATVTYGKDGDFDRFCSRFGVTVGQAAAAIPLGTRLDLVKQVAMMADVDTDELNVNGFDAQKFIHDFTNNIADRGAEGLFQVLLTVLQPESELPNVPAALAFLNAYFPHVCWEVCFISCMARLQKRDFHSLFARKVIAFPTHRVDGMQVLSSVSTVADFQTHIQKRIHHHAERVQSFKLAAAPLVEQDMERSMTQVWKSLPSGFGARKVKKSTDARGPSKGSDSPLRNSLHYRRSVFSQIV